MSHNLITDITPITASVGGAGAFAGFNVDLSYNNISDASPLWKNGASGDWMRRDWDNPRLTTGFNLDHNHVKDLSGLATLPASASNNPAALSFLDQDITLPNSSIGQAVQLPAATGPDGKAVTLTSADGPVDEQGQITYDTGGKKSVTWAKTQAQYARFSGTYRLTIGQSASTPTLSVSPKTPQAGGLMTFTGDGFQPGEQVTFTWDDGQTSNMGTVTADASGEVTFAWRTLDPSQHGKVTVTATGAGGASAKVGFALSSDTTVTIPDTNLRMCFTDALGLPAGSPLYRSVTDRMEGTLDCRGRGIKILTGLDAFTKGQILLNGNALTSLSTLPTLSSSVWALDVSNNAIAATGTMESQEHGVQQVKLSGNQIIDFTDLQKAHPSYNSALSQTIDLPMALTGQKVAIPQVRASDVEDSGSIATIEYRLPDGATSVGASDKTDGSAPTVTFAKPGTYEVGFTVYFRYAGGGENPPWASGVFTVNVVAAHQKVLNINPATLYAGQMLNATGAGFDPGEGVTFTLGTNGSELGQAIVNEFGTARITNAVVPLGTQPGNYHVVATGARSGVTVSAVLTVKVIPAQVPTTTRPAGMPAGTAVVSYRNGKGGSGGAGAGRSAAPGPQGPQSGPGLGLPATGGEGAAAGFPAAVLLLLAVAGVLAARRRKN